MTQYAKDVDGVLEYPRQEEFVGIPNWQQHDFKLRQKKYKPLVGTPEEREGYTAEPKTWHLVEQSSTRIEPRREDPVTKEPFMEDVMEEDPETHEMKKTGERQVTRDTPITVDESYYQVDEWEYTPIPEPEPEPVPVERNEAEKAIVRRILQLVDKYDAMEDLQGMDLTIPGLLALAQSKAVSDVDLQAVKSDVAILVLDLMAKEGGDWASCWDGLKSRFMQWVAEIMAEQQQQN